MPNMNNIDPKKWIITFGKSIGYATRDVVVDKLPNTSSILSEIGNSVSEARNSVETAVRDKTSDFGQLNIQTIKNTSQYRNAMKAIDSVISDIKSGNIAHAVELTDIDSFEDDLGIDFDLDEETSVDEDGNETATIAGITNDAKVNAQATIRSAKAITLSLNQFSKDFAKIQRATSKGSTQAVVHATIVSTNLLHSDLSGINKRLDIMNVNIGSLVKLGEANSNANEQAVKHYARMEEAFTMFMKMQNEANGKSPETKTSAVEDLIKYGFNPTSFKNLLKENFARIGADSMVELVSQFAGMFKDMNVSPSDLFNLSGPVRNAIERLLPKKTMASIENFDRKIPRRLNNLLSRLGDYEDAGGALGLVSQLVGLRTRGTARIELGKYNKGATAWSGTSKKALEEVIPHYLASIDEVLHKFVAKDSSYEAAYFDYDKGVFRSRSQIRTDFRNRMQSERRRLYYDSRTSFESALKDKYGNFVVSDQVLNDTRNKISKIVDTAVTSDTRITDIARSILAVLRNPELNLTPEQINDITDAYLSDIRKERLMITKDLNAYVGSNAGSAYRQLAIGSQRTGYNDQIIRDASGKITRIATTDMYGYADIESDISGSLWKETSGERKAREEARIRKEKAERRSREISEKIKEVSKTLPKSDPRIQKLINLKNKIDRGSIIPPWMDAEISAWIDSAGLAIDSAIFGDYDAETGSYMDKAKGYASQTFTKMKANQNRIKNITRVGDFNNAIKKMQINGVYLSPNLFTVHTRGGGDNPEFAYAELDNLVVGYPKRINASDVDPIHQIIKNTNISYVTNVDYDKYVRSEEERKKKASINTNDAGHGRRIRSNNKIIGRAAEAADTNATRAAKSATVNVNIGDLGSRFRAGEDRSLMDSMKYAWSLIEKKLGGKENIKNYLKSGGKGALVGGTLGAFFLPTGPIGGAILGAAAGILSSKVDFKKILFGEKIVDDEGRVIGIKKTGIVNQWLNTFQTGLIDNARQEMQSVGSEVRAYWNEKMVPELNKFFEERSLKFKSATDLLAKTIVNISKIIINPFKFLNDTVNNLARTIMNVGVRTTGFALKSALKLGITALAAPVKVLNRARDLADYGMGRLIVQGGIGAARSAATRISYLGSQLAHPIKAFKGENEKYSDYRERKGAFGIFGPKVIDGKVDVTDIDREYQDKLSTWEYDHSDLLNTDRKRYYQERAAYEAKLRKKADNKKLNRQLRFSNWNYRTDKVKGAEDKKVARETTIANREYNKLITKYNKRDHSKFQNLSEDEAKKRYESLSKVVGKQSDKSIKDAFELIDKNNPSAADIENFILNPKAFATMKNNEIASQQKETKTDNFMSNVLHGLGSIVNIMSDGKFTTELNTSKEVKIPNYGNDETGDGYINEEEKKDESKEDYNGPLDESIEMKIRNFFSKVSSKASETKSKAKNAYSNFKQNMDEHGSVFGAIKDSYNAHRANKEALRKARLVDLRSDYANPYENDESGQGWHRNASMSGHGIGATLMNVGSKLIGGLKTAGSVAKTVGSKVWSGVKAGASAVSNFFGKNGESTVDSSGNIISYDASGNPVTSSTSQTKEATTKESNQSLSGSLKAGPARSGNFSSAALDNSYKQNMLSGMNAALFLLSKGAYNPGFSLGKTGGSGNLQMDNVAKKEAQYEVAVGSVVSNLTEKAAAARTTNGKDANAPLVAETAKQAVIANDNGKQQTGLLETIASGITNLPGLIAAALPAVLGGGTLAMIIEAIKSALGKGGAYDEALGNQDADGNRTLYTDENGNIVDADDPNANKSIVYNHRLKEKILSKGTFDLAKGAAGMLYNSKPVQAIVNSKPVQGVASIGKKAATFITGKKFGVDPTDIDYLTDFIVDDAGNMVYNPSGPNIIQRFKSSKIGQVASSVGNKIANSTPVQKVVGGVKSLAGSAINTGKSVFNTAKTAVTSKAASLADSAMNVGKQVASFASQKASALKQGAGTVLKNITGKADELATNALSKVGAKVSETTGRVAATDMWKNICSKFDDIINKLDNSKLKNIVGGAVDKVVTFLRKCMTKVKSVAPNILEKFSSKISSFADEIAAKATKAIPIVGWAISAVTGVYDLVSGWFDAANLFYVNEEDVDGTMRTVSALVKFLFNSCPYASMAATFITLVCEFFEIDAAHWFANQLYNIIWGVTHGGDQSGNTLEQKQADFASEVDEYNKNNGTNVSVRAYSDQENQTFTQKIGNAASNLWDKITGKNKGQTHGGGGGREGVRESADVGRGSFIKFSPVGHGKRKAIIGHGAIDQDGNIDNSGMKGQYTGLQDNGSTIQNGAYYFAQSDDRWKNETLSGFSSSIGKSGCVMTSAAMGASTLLNQSINPSVFNANYGNGNTSMGTRFGDLGLKVTRYPAGSSQSSHHPYTEVADVVTSALRQRKPVMLYGTKTKDSIYWDGGKQSDAHCVLATAMDQNGNIIVNNPSGTKAQKNYGWKKTHPIESLQDVHWVQVMEKNDGSGMFGILNTSGYSSSGNTATAAGTNATSSYSAPATTGGANETSSASSDPFTSAWSAIASGLSSLGGTLLSNLFKNNSGRSSNEEAPNAAGADTVGHGRNYRQDDPSVANLPTGQGWKMKDGGCGVATIANMISGHGSDLLKSSYAASMNHFVDGGLTGDGMAATLSDMGYDPQSVTDTNTLNSLLARGVHVAALGAGHGSSAFPKNSPHWVDLQGYDPFTGKYTWMDPEKGLRTGNLDPSEISSAITIGHGAVGADGKETNAHMNVHTSAKKITAKIYTPTNLTSSEFNDTIDKTARSYDRDPNGFLWNKKGSALVDAEKKYGINGLSLLGIAQTESGLNSSNKAIQKNNATSIMGSNGLKTYGSPEENIDGTGQLLGVKYKDWFGSTSTYDIAPHYCPDIPSIGQYSSKWADNVTNYTTRFAAIAKGGDGSNTQNIETDKGSQNAGAFSITDSSDITPSASIAGSSSYSSSASSTSQPSSDSSDPFTSGWSSISSGMTTLGGTLLSNLFKNSGHGQAIGHGGAKTGGISANMLSTGGFVDDSIMGESTDTSLVTGNTNSGVTSRNNNTKIVGKMDIIISILRAMLKTSQASAKAQPGHGSNAARTSSTNKNNTVGHGSNSENSSLVRYRPTKTMRDRSRINRYGSALNISNPENRVSTDADYLRQVHTSISTGARKNLI